VSDCQYLSDSMSLSVASGTALDQCPVVYLLLAWRDLLVVFASTQVTFQCILVAYCSAQLLIVIFV